MDLRIAHNVIRSDIAGATVFYYRRTGRLWRNISAVFYSGAGLVSLTIPDIRWAGVVLLFCAAYNFSAPWIMSVIMVRRYFSNPKLGRDVKLQITDERLDAQSELSSGSQNWDTFTAWMESPEAFLLIVYKGYYMIIPKRGFESDEDISVFRAFLQQTFGEARR